MTNASTPDPSGVSINTEGEAAIGGDVVGRDKIVHHHYGAQPAEAGHGVRLTVHVASFLDTGVACYFINAANLSERAVEVTHVWLACQPDLHVVQPARPLPKRLQPAESWETWVEVHRVPDACGDVHYLARARLSTSEVVHSVKHEPPPGLGHVPGGPIAGQTGASGRG